MNTYERTYLHCHAAIGHARDARTMAKPASERASEKFSPPAIPLERISVRGVEWQGQGSGWTRRGRACRGGGSIGSTRPIGPKDIEVDGILAWPGSRPHRGPRSLLGGGRR
eukprot:6172663-Pleurochrysis_carterae.AAC.1